jgi:hypothetical protein
MLRRTTARRARRRRTLGQWLDDQPAYVIVWLGIAIGSSIVGAYFFVLGMVAG